MLENKNKKLECNFRIQRWVNSSLCNSLPVSKCPINFRWKVVVLGREFLAPRTRGKLKSHTFYYDKKINWYISSVFWMSKGHIFASRENYSTTSWHQIGDCIIHGARMHRNNQEMTQIEWLGRFNWISRGRILKLCQNFFYTCQHLAQ